MADGSDSGTGSESSKISKTLRRSRADQGKSANMGTVILRDPKKPVTKRTKETKFGPRRGSTPPGNHSNKVR